MDNFLVTVGSEDTWQHSQVGNFLLTNAVLRLDNKAVTNSVLEFELRQQTGCTIYIYI